MPCRVGIVGATGAVGREMMRVLHERRFPVADLVPLASPRSAGRTVSFDGESIRVRVAEPTAFRGLDLVLFSAGASVSRALAPEAVKAGAVVVDNSSAFRQDPDIPLVVPEVNPHRLAGKPPLVANPNCSTIQLVVALAPIHRAVPLRRVFVASYQAVSGAGARAIRTLDREVREYAREPEPAGDDAHAFPDAPRSRPVFTGEGRTMEGAFPHPIAFNVIPLIGEVGDDGFTEEERKLHRESRKILETDDLFVHGTCVRVPVFRAHSEAVFIEASAPLTVERVRSLLSGAPGVTLQDEPRKFVFPMPLFAAGTDDVYVGRIRATAGGGIACWVVADQLRKGAATNAVQIAERLLG